MLKKKSFKWMFALVGAALLSGSVLTACSDDEKKEVTGEEGKGENGGGGNSEPELNFDGSPYITKVLDYRPAPGQFVNTMPAYKEGDTQETMNQKVLVAIGNGNKGVITLGAYGGYVIVGFDHTIQNVAGKRDFRVLGNAFYAAANPNPEVTKKGGSCEPGIVMVAFDKNKNGKPDDDEWYELAGSEYEKTGTIKNYQITYHSPDESKTPVGDDNDPSIIDKEYIRWTDNQGGSGYIPKNSFNAGNNYYPKWISDETISYLGTLLPENGVNESKTESQYWVLYAYDWGYADNAPNAEEGCTFDIDWAVNKDGKKVSLPGVDFIKIYTGVNQVCGRLGEVSTEVSGIEDLHLIEK